MAILIGEWPAVCLVPPRSGHNVFEEQRTSQRNSPSGSSVLYRFWMDITVAKELLGQEDIKTTTVYAKADTRFIRDAIRSFDVLDKSGYKMVTKGGSGTRKLLKKNSASALMNQEPLRVPGTGCTLIELPLNPLIFVVRHPLTQVAARYQSRSM